MLRPFNGGFLPLPILPASQVAATSYEQHLAYIEWYLNYLANEVNGISGEVTQLTGTGDILDQSTVVGTYKYVVTGKTVTLQILIPEAPVTTTVALQLKDFPVRIPFAQRTTIVNTFSALGGSGDPITMVISETSNNVFLTCMDAGGDMYTSALAEANEFVFNFICEPRLA